MRLVLVHGRAQGGQNPLALRQIWTDALRSGLAKIDQKLPLDLTVAFPFYGDLLDSLTAKPPTWSHNRVKGGDPPSGQAEAQIAAEILLEMATTKGLGELGGLAEHTALTQKGLLNWVAVHEVAKLLDDAGLGGLLLTQFTRDVSFYLMNPLIRSTIDRTVLQTIQGEKCIVVAHSLGTVVAYNVLRATDDADVLKFVTLGSPLGIKAIRSRLSPPALAIPPGVRNWFNGRDPSDIVALFPLTPQYFPVDGEIEDHSSIRNREVGQRHSIVDYLSDARVASEIHEGLKLI